MRKRTTGILLISVGALLIAASVGMYVFYAHQELQAEQNAQLLLNEVTQEMERQQEIAIYETVTEEELPVGESPQISGIGYDFIGVIRIPTAEIELPVLNSWSYDLLQIAPCRYSGSIEEQNLILLGHNYKKHFGPLKKIKADDTIELCDVRGTTYTYEVAQTEVLEKTELDRLTASDYDLTIFTCTNGGYSRFVVRCNACLVG